MSNLVPYRAEPRSAAGPLRKVAAAALDFFFAFFFAGYFVGYLTGNLTKGGFELTGVPALVVLAAIALSFVIFAKYLGGTVWQRLLGIR
jgi:hypothetical protein